MRRLLTRIGQRDNRHVQNLLARVKYRARTWWFCPFALNYSHIPPNAQDIRRFSVNLGFIESNVYFVTKGTCKRRCCNEG